jgi:RNA polymerase sigma factor (sigma-70 family)
MDHTPSLSLAIDWRQTLLTNREQALERIYAKTYRMVLSYVRKHGGSTDDAKDILHEALILFYEKIVHNQFTLTASISTYLMAICKNLWKQELEKRTRTTDLTDTQTDSVWEMPVTGTDSPLLKLMDFVEQLGEKCKNILVSFYYFGQRLEQITTQHGYQNVRTTTVQKFKCLERLRKAVSHLSFERFN